MGKEVISSEEMVGAGELSSIPQIIPIIFICLSA